MSTQTSMRYLTHLGAVLSFSVALLAAATGSAPGTADSATAGAIPGSVGPSPQAATSAELLPWVGPDGNPLPFASHEELMEFLRTAEITERVRINEGINGIDRVVLEKDGITLRGGWRDVDIRERNLRVGKQFYLLFRDSYIFECAAYEVAQMLGIDNIPPTVIRPIGRRDGSLQLWLETIRDVDDSFMPSSSLEWLRQVWTMYLFDALVYNVDRNPGNLAVDLDDKLWLIDHTRAFQIKSELLDIERVNLVRRDVWENMQAIDPDDLSRRLQPYLESQQVVALQTRLEKLIEYIQALIDERGEGSVLF